MVVTMNQEQYHRQNQMHGLLISSENVENLEYFTQLPQLATSFDGLPRQQPLQDCLINSPSDQIIPTSNNYSPYMNSMAMAQNAVAWDGSPQASASFDEQYTNGFYRYTPTIPESSHDSGFLPNGQIHTTYHTPRSLPSSGDSRLSSQNNMVGEYERSIYDFSQVRPDFNASFSCTPGLPCNNTLDNLRDFPRLSLSRSPRIQDDLGASPLSQPPAFTIPSSRASEDGGCTSREQTTVGAEELASDEPYAKLIYRALMSAPNHSMVLQEIYQWFRDNTGKGGSDTKGWMNSIRHNLSMNAAFKKTERKLAGDDTKKSTEWVLEDFAVKDGVQSTTRYRKGTGAKPKWNRAEAATPSRMIAGQKGGRASSKNKTQRQVGRVTEEHSRRSTQVIDAERRSRFHHQTRVHNSQQRDRSPQTPPNYEGIALASPYFQPKQEPLDISFDDLYSLEDVHGVFNQDGPVFSNHHETHFSARQLMSNHQY